MDSRAESYTQPMTGFKQRYADTAPQIIPVGGTTRRLASRTVISSASRRDGNTGSRCVAWQAAEHFVVALFSLPVWEF